MKLKLLVPILLLVNSFYLSAQVNENETFSKKELNTFAKIYKHTLDHPFDIAGSMKKCAQDITISEERMGEILQAQFSGRNIKLSNEERVQLEKLKTLMEVDKLQYRKEIDQFIVSNGMKPSKYVKIEKTFQNNEKLKAEVNKLAVKN